MTENLNQLWEERRNFNGILLLPLLQKEVQGESQRFLVIIQLLLPREMSDLEAVCTPFFLFRIMPVVLRSV